jgi:hypothetical protein
MHLMNKKLLSDKTGLITWVAIYAIEGGVTLVIPWMRALPDRVALGSLSTELGEVNTCLYACIMVSVSNYI